MTLGSGVFWATLILVLAAGVYQVSVRNKWKLVGKIVLVVILLSVVVGICIWVWLKYEERPYVVHELQEIRLGMMPLDVKLLKGEPNRVLDLEQRDEGGFKLIWIYTSSFDDAYTSINFYGETPEALKASVVCQHGGYSQLLGFGSYDSEKRVADKLGKPTNVSIYADGTKKYVSYSQWQVAYLIEKGDVSNWCISSSGKVAFQDEYGNDTVDAQE